MKRTSRSISIKLWGYFILFTAVIIVGLWILQTVLLQSFYTAMQTENIRRVAGEISDSIDSDDFDEKIVRLASDNSLLIILTSKSLRVFYSVDEYSSLYSDPKVRQRSLPRDYSDFLERLEESPDGTVCYQLDSTDEQNKPSLVYGQMIPYKKIDAVLYINTPLGAVGSTVLILRSQLYIVTALAVLIALLIAFIVSRRISKPIKALSDQANKMAKGDFSILFDKGFCLELDELSATLDHAAHELSINEKLRRDLLANVSHDLRTPLTIIKCHAELISDFSSDEDAQTKQDSQIIIRETDRLTAAVNDILDYSKLQSGTAQFEFTTVNISLLTEAIIESFSAMCAKNNIRIEGSVEPDMTATADHRRLEQVVYNLISNALKHVGDDRTVYVSVFGKAGAVRTEVRDNGAGIAEEELSHIWDRYFTEKKRSADGTGLGLAIVKEILTSHKARFGVDSKKGAGSVFWFELDGQEDIK